MESILSLNELSPDEFASALRPLFEAAAPLTDALYTARPFTSYEALIDAAESLATAMPFADQVAVLNAHPRIGENPTRVSPASYREQGHAGEAGMSREELDAIYRRLDQLNREYERRFGFRFVVFVNKRPKAEIVKVLQERIMNARDAELETGLREMFRIARDRLWSSP